MYKDKKPWLAVSIPITFNPLSIIQKENKLTRPNYIDWKRNLNLVLTAEEYKFVLTDVCSPLPDCDSSKEEIEAY